MSRPAAVMHLIAANFYGGPEKQTVEHLKRLDRRRFRGILASFVEGSGPNELLRVAAEAGLESRGLPMAGPADLRALGALAGALEREEVTLLCTHGYKATILGWLAARRRRIPVLAFSRGYTGENAKVAFYEWLERKVLARVAGVVCVSEGQERRLLKLGIKCRRSWVVRNAVDGSSRTGPVADPSLKPEICRRLGAPEGKLLVVAAGRLSREKGHRYLLEAIRRLGPKADGGFFVICGEGPLRGSLERRARRLGVAERCRFAGFRKDLPEVFQAMDFLVLPSLTEGLPNVVLEAFASGKTAVASEVGGVGEVIEDGRNGFLVPPGDPGALAAALERLLSAPGALPALGRAARETVQSRFSFDEQTELLVSVYDQVLRPAS
jgi:glycosyltransferase involved in cell wall biosynthesis